MTIGGHKRTRSERVAALELPPGQWERAWKGLRRRDVLGRIGLALLATLAIGAVIRAWDPPFAFRPGYVPLRNVVATVPFSREDSRATEADRDRARSRVLYLYVQDPEPLRQLRAELVTTVAAILSGDGKPTLWDDFQLRSTPGIAAPTPRERQEQLRQFQEALAGDSHLAEFEKDTEAAFAPFEKRGLLESLPQLPERGNQREILVQQADQPGTAQRVRVDDARIGDGSAVHNSLLANLESNTVANHVFAWLRPRLMATLSLKDEEATRRALQQAAIAVEPVVRKYVAGQLLVRAGQPIDSEEEIALLQAEYRATLAQRAAGEKLARGAAVVAMVFAMFVLCGIYMRYRQRGPLASIRRLSMILLLVVVTVALCRWADQWQVELIPLMLFGMTVAIAYRQEMALLLCAVLALVVVVAVGQGLNEFLLMVGTTTTANLNMARIRSRSKLIYVGLFAGGVAVLLTLGLGIIQNQRIGAPLLTDAVRAASCAVASGFLMTGLLPFIERLFGVLTDLSLLELGDVAHPLLQELIRRAPSTYNHSVTVGSIAEAAAESIGARGLLVRVGAYFHDIGKMLKPGYFIENQGPGASRHEALVPAMSSLVIVAHIKDGSDLARQHHLPQPIIDLIEQHHGTTLVKFFYDRAAEQKQADPNAGDVDESTYRYPGPKPQTKEAAVLMLADNVESASRTLVDPTPARIESLVRELAERRLHGGQFDESGLTLRELRTIERSMVKSLTSIYHGRLKYPDQRTA
ncbi:MAG: HDIG domain-containing protein [Pirellulales bacterium]|nr:HDIG domain-containing protein [Pirellulales bacterium]